MDLAQLAPSQVDPESPLELRFTVLDTEFSFVHSADSEINGLMLVTCLLGPLPKNREGEACWQLLAANYALSSAQLSAFALDGNGNAIYTHSHVVGAADVESLALLINGLAALSMRWRSEQLPSVRELSLAGYNAGAASALA